MAVARSFEIGAPSDQVSVSRKGRIETQEVAPCRFKMRLGRLRLLCDGVHVAEAPLERAVLEDRV